MDKQDNGLNILKTKFTKDNKYYEIDLVPQEPKYTYRVFEVNMPVGVEQKDYKYITDFYYKFLTQFRTRSTSKLELRAKAKKKLRYETNKNK